MNPVSCFTKFQDSGINRIISQIVFVLLIAYGDVYVHANADAQLLVTQDSAIGKYGIVLDEFDDNQPDLIASPQQSKPFIAILALSFSATHSNIISSDIVDGHGI